MRDSLGGGSRSGGAGSLCARAKDAAASPTAASHASPAKAGSPFQQSRTGPAQVGGVKRATTEFPKEIL